MERVILRHLKGSKSSQIEEFPLQQFAELMIGRDPSSTVRFDPDKDDLVGRQHARITRDPSDPYRFKLFDLNSRNGTYLNKLRVVGEMPLQPGDVIQLGAGGPEIQFDLDPLPAQYVKATRLGVAGPIGATSQGGVKPTTVGSGAGASAGPVSGGSPMGVANSVGKATVERLIGQTKKQASRNMYLAVGVAVVLIGVVTVWQKWRADREAERGRLAAADTRQKAAGAFDSLGKSVARAESLSKMLTPAEIADRYAQATVQIDFSWNLIYAPTGTQVFHLYVPNRYRTRQGGAGVLMANGARAIPAYKLVGQNEIEPALTIDGANGAPIAVSGSGSGFVVTSDGFILTNRHVAANWRAPYHFDPNAAGVLLDENGNIMLSQAGTPIIVNPPARWVPSETKQAGPKGGLDVFRGRQEYLMVRFRKNTNPAEANTERVSDRHDVALIKINTPSTLPKVELFDSYNQTKVGDQVTVMGYPGVSDFVVAVLKSKDTFNRDAQQRVVPDPTLSVGNIGKIVRAADGPATDAYATYSPTGDTFQLTINSTGSGNSGGPMFDAYGRVVGIFFAGKTSDVQITFAVPIRYGLELMSITPNTR